MTCTSSGRKSCSCCNFLIKCAISKPTNRVFAVACVYNGNDPPAQSTTITFKFFRTISSSRISDTQFESGVSMKPWIMNLVPHFGLKLLFLMPSLSSATSSWPSMGFFSVYKMNRVLMTLRGNGNTLKGRWIKWYHSRVIFKHPISP